MKIRYLVLLVVGVFITNFSARADSVDHDGILRNQHGQVRVALTQAQAAEACAKHGMHLPTIRQMLKFYQAAGMLIKEVNEISNLAQRARYESAPSKGAIVAAFGP